MTDKKEMVYTGGGLQVVLPDTGEVTDLAKGDVVGYEAFGGEAFFGGRTDFKPHPAATRKGKKTDG